MNRFKGIDRLPPRSKIRSNSFTRLCSPDITLYHLFYAISPFWKDWSMSTRFWIMYILSVGVFSTPFRKGLSRLLFVLLNSGLIWTIHSLSFLQTYQPPTRSPFYHVLFWSLGRYLTFPHYFTLSSGQSSDNVLR